jgi:hypothetical protein
MRKLRFSSAPRSQPVPRGDSDAKGWRYPLATTAVGATVTVLVTAIVGGAVTWLSHDDRESGSVASEAPPFALVKEVTRQCPEFVADLAPDAVPPVPGSPEEREAWKSFELGARLASAVNLEVTVTGTTPTAVVLHSLTAVVVPAPPTGGSAIYRPNCPPPTLAPLRRFLARLDATRPTVTLHPSRGRDFPYKISSTEPEVFHIIVWPGQCDCDWTLQLAWTSGDRAGTVTIDDEGKPFRSASSRGRVGYEYDWNARQWVIAMY